jgi:hypothetical protein
MRPNLLALALLAAAATSPASAQIPDTFTNLQVLPKDIGRDSLVAIMRRFSMSLGVRCQYCHVGGDGVSFDGVRFADDDDPDKVKARYMLRMVGRLNDELLAGLPQRDEPHLRVACVTCHHGQAKPETLEAVLARALEQDGVDSAVAHYRNLRDTYFGSGVFDFRARSLMELARTLAVGSKTAESARFLELNAEFYTRDAFNWIQLGDVRRIRGEREAALAAFDKALEIDPQNAVARSRIQQLRGGEP